MSVFTGKEKLKLGFGLMRLPKNEDGSIDVDQTSLMVDEFMKAGGTYFDTAYVYEGSEQAIKKALVDRYPRDSYTLTSKLFINSELTTLQEALNEINISLERTGAGYFDYYLVHAVQRNNYLKFEEYGIWDYVKKLKQDGLIKHYGFSFHGDPELLEELLQKHPDAEFVQLQMNYADWDNPGVAARINYEICMKHNKPVVVMEPVKGGILADPIDSVKNIFDAYGNNLSYSSWAIRYVASLDNILSVLSGMSNLEQMKDNLSYMKDFKPLNDEELKVIDKVIKAIEQDKSIPCTACHYCTDGCPCNIPIPEIFNMENRKKGSPEFRTKREYAIITNGKGKASDCVECGQCESVCPQHLEIMKLLKLSSRLEN